MKIKKRRQLTPRGIQEFLYFIKQDIMSRDAKSFYLEIRRQTRSYDRWYEQFATIHVLIEVMGDK